MKDNNKLYLKNIYTIRQMLVSIMVFIILTWAFFKNQMLGKIIIGPFLICSIAIFFENLFILLKREKIANVFKYIFRICFFIYVFGLLIYATYYAIINKTYSLFIIIGIFLVGIVHFFKATFFKTKK